jgi:branched-chain amino acid transport system permease protein
VAVLMVVSLIVVHRILKSNLGRAFEALRDSPIASDCMGVSVYRYKVYAFIISAALAGLAGACMRIRKSTSRPIPTTSS